MANPHLRISISRVMKKQGLDKLGEDLEWIDDGHIMTGTQPRDAQERYLRLCAAVYRKHRSGKTKGALGRKCTRE